MRWFVFLALATLLPAQAIVNTGRHRTVTAAASYTGPGDIVSFLAWGGLRAYSAATRGAVALNVCNPSDVACADVSTDATTGNLVLTTIGGHDCTMDDCTVKKIYDQTAGGNCAGSCDLVQATIANRFTLKHNCINSTLWCLVEVPSQIMSSAGSATLPIPFSMSSVAERNGAFSSFGNVIGTSIAGNIEVGFNNSANTVFLFGNVFFTASASDSAFHSLQALFDSTSKIVVDGSVTTGGAEIGAGTDVLCVGACGNAPTALAVEFGWTATDLSSSFSALSTNQHSYWGF